MGDACDNKKLEYVIEKLTTKELEWLVSLTKRQDTMSSLINLLFKKISQTEEDVIVLRIFTIIHYLLSSENEAFKEYLASSLTNLDSALRKRSGSSMFIQNYFKFISEKVFLKAYGKTDHLIEEETLLHSVLELHTTAISWKEKIHILTVSLLLKEGINAFNEYTNMIVKNLGNFVNLNKKKSRKSLHGYKKYLESYKLFRNFLKEANSLNNNINIVIPSVNEPPSGLLQSLEQISQGKKELNSKINLEMGISDLLTTNKSLSSTVANVDNYISKRLELSGAWKAGPPQTLFSSTTTIIKQNLKRPYQLTSYSKVDLKKNLVEYDIEELMDAAREYFKNNNFIQASEKMWLAAVTTIKKNMYSIHVKVSSHSGINECANLLLKCTREQNLDLLLDMKDNWYSLEKLHQFHYGDITISRKKFRELMENGEILIKFLNHTDGISKDLLKKKFDAEVKQGSFVLDELNFEIPLKFARNEYTSTYKYIFMDKDKRRGVQN